MLKAAKGKPAARTPKPTSSATPRVYSYIRFSTPEQKLGDSERRQIERAMAWAEAHKMPFDDFLKDEGLSAFHGRNRKAGALGRFLELVEQRKVPVGSVLIVEAIDRLTRENFVDAIKTIIFDLINNGIVIQTLGHNETTYDRKALNTHAIFGLIGAIQEAFHSSQLKSERLVAARDRARAQARDSGRLLTPIVPSWLKVIKKQDDRKCKEISEATKSLVMLFKLKLKRLSIGAIEKKLNAEAPWKPPAKTNHTTAPGWRRSYINKILRNRAVIGEYQPYRQTGGRYSKREPVGDPIPDYYPVVVPPELFWAVQEMLNANKEGTKPSGGRRDQQSNLFQKIVDCAYCGHSMTMRDKGKPPKGRRYLVCDAAKRCDDKKRGVACTDNCKRNNVRYDEIERTVLHNCHKLKPEAVLPDPNEQAVRCESLKQELDGLRGSDADLTGQIDRYVDQIGRTDDAGMRDRFEQKAKALQAQQTALHQTIKKKEAELREAERSAKSFENWKRDFETLMKRLDDVETRMRLHGHLRDLIDKVEVFGRGHRRLYDSEAQYAAECAARKEAGRKLKPFELARHPAVRKASDGDDLADKWHDTMMEYAPAELWRSKKFRRQFHEFLKQVTARRMTHEGRFLRLHLKTGAQIDIVPAGSLASGRQLTTVEDEDGKSRVWRFVEPNQESLWNDFCRQHLPSKPAKSRRKPR